MHLLAICATRDEDDLIEPFVRHTLALVDGLVVLDNGSTDSTPQILRALQAEGLPLEVRREPTVGWYQAGLLTRAMREAARAHAPDWVLPLDTDELLVPAPGEPARWAGAAALEAGGGPRALDWWTYVPDPADDAGEPNPLLRLRHRLAARSGEWRKVVVPGALAAEPSASLGQGSHALLAGGHPVAMEPLDGALAHFPARSPGQTAAKVVLHRLQYLAMHDADPAWGLQYRQLFDQLLEAPGAFVAGFPQAWRAYAGVGAAGEERELAPLRYLGGPLRHAREGAGSLEGAVSRTLAFAAALAASHARAQAQRVAAEAEAAAGARALAQAREDAEASARALAEAQAELARLKA